MHLIHHDEGDYIQKDIVIYFRWSLESAGLIVFEKRLGALSNKIDWADKMVDLNKQVLISSHMDSFVVFFVLNMESELYKFRSSDFRQK